MATTKIIYTPLGLKVTDKFCPRCGGSWLRRPMPVEYRHRRGQLFCNGCRNWMKEAEIDMHTPSPEQFYEWLKSKNGTSLDQVCADLGVGAKYLRRFCNAMEKIHGDVRKAIDWGVKKDSPIKKAARKAVARPWAAPIEKGIPLWYAIHLLSMANHEEQLDVCERVKDGALNLSRESANRLRPFLKQGKNIVLATTRSDEASLAYALLLAMIADDAADKYLTNIGFGSVISSNATRKLIELGILERSSAGHYMARTEFLEELRKSVEQISPKDLEHAARGLTIMALNICHADSWDAELKKSFSSWATDFCNNDIIVYRAFVN